MTTWLIKLTTFRIWTLRKIGKDKFLIGKRVVTTIIEMGMQ